MSILSTRRMLLHTKGNYTFVVTVHFNQLDPPTESPQCPRVNTWGAVDGAGPYIESSSTQTTDYSWFNDEVGLDVFYWNGTGGKPNQKVSVIASGYYGTPTDEVADPITNTTQNKYQLKYRRPGTYHIDITIYDVMESCGGGTKSFSAALPRPLDDPYYYTVDIGSYLGPVRVRGSFKGAPDRVVLWHSDAEVLDSRYRGATSQNFDGTGDNYRNEISAVYIAAGYTPEEAEYESLIIPCTSCGAVSDRTNSRFGDFDLLFDKTTTSPILSVFVYSPISTYWDLWIYCPRYEIKTPLFGYNFFPIRETYATSCSANCYFGVCATDISAGPSTVVAKITNNNHHRSWASSGYDINKTMHDQHSVFNQYYGFAAYTVGTLTATITGSYGIELGRGGLSIAAGGPMSAALIYNTSDVWDGGGDYTVVADFKVNCDEQDGSFNVSSPFDSTSIINAALSANPITLVPNVTTYFRFVPYAATSNTGTFRLYDSEIFGGGEDMAFYGYVSTP